MEHRWSLIGKELCVEGVSEWENEEEGRIAQVR